MRTSGVVLVCAFSCVDLWAQSQSTSQIQGTVQDASGSTVPGAQVKATQTDTGAVSVTSSGNDGTYVLANLPIGPYRLEVSKPGFSTYVQTGIVLQVATNPTIDISLKVGTVSEQVQVEANADAGGNAGHRRRNRDGKPAHFGIAAQRPRGDRPDPIYACGNSPGCRGQRRLPRHPAVRRSPADRLSASHSVWMAAFTTIRGIWRTCPFPSRTRCRSLRSKPVR